MTVGLFLSLFANTLPEQASLRMLDLFLLEGMHSSKVIFDMTIGYLQSIEGKVTSARDQEELQDVL